MRTLQMSRNGAAQGVCAMLLLAVATSLILPSSAVAQKRRKGFILNLGLGAAGVSSSYEGPVSNRRTKAAVGTDFKIGHAATDQILIYYSNDAAFYNETDFYGDDQLVAVGLSGVGVTYFLQPSVPSFYVDGTIGIAARNLLSYEDATVDGTGGWGVAVGGGYEFARHFMLDADLILGRLDGGLNTSTLRVGLIWLLY